MKSNTYIRVLAFVMLLAMIHYMVGYRLLYSVGILYAKEEAKESIIEKNRNVQKITLSGADYNSLKWTEKNKEFSLNNEMFDIVNTQKQGESYVLTVYSDSVESNWISALHNYEKELFLPDKSAKGTKSAEDVMSSFQKEYTPVSEFKLPVFVSVGLIQPTNAVKLQPLQVSANIWHPPTSC